MKLSDLARACAQYVTERRGDCEVLLPCMDSRKKTERGLFFCISGARFDAHDYAAQAVQNGAAALVVRYALGNEAQEMTQDIVWFPSLTLNFPFTLLLTAVACWLGMRLRIPSGAMLLPMLLGALAQGGGWLMLELPEWLLAMAYAVLGWTVGLQFNKAIFLLALKTLPQIIASIIGLILMCALMALALTHILQMDFMTAYLATSPGGLDTVAIIAAGTRADMSFIMAPQTLRLFTILLTGPAMARAISRYAPRQ